MTDTKISALPELLTATSGDVLPITHLGTTYKIQEQNLVIPQVNADWNAISGVAQILNKPILAQTMTNVLHKWLNSYNATTGLFTQTQPDYSDLTNLPQLAQTSAAAANKFLTAYDATTGLFTNAQPDWSNLSGIPSTFPIATPGTLTVSSTNSASGAHTHQITSSSNTGVAAAILATDADGLFRVAGASFSGNAAMTAATAGELRVAAADNGIGEVRVDSYGAGVRSLLRMARTDNTAASPSAVQLNDNLGEIWWSGYKATAMSLAAVKISAFAAENFTDTATGTYMGIYTCPIGSITPTERIHIDAAGKVNVVTSFSIAGGTAYTVISSNPGAAAAILATDANGYTQVVRLGAGVSPSYPIHAAGEIRSTVSGLNALQLSMESTYNGISNSTLQFFLQNSTPASTLFGAIAVSNSTRTAGSENGVIKMDTVVAGSLTVCATFGGGLQMGAPTGGDKGAGTINTAADIYKNGTAYTNPAYALEHWAEGSIITHADKPGAQDYRRLTLGEVEDYVRRHYELPGHRDSFGLFDGGDWMLEKVEELFTHLLEMDKRVTKLEREYR